MKRRIAVGALLVPELIAAQEGCFEAQPPSCEYNSTSKEEYSNISAQDVCFMLETNYLGENDNDLFNLSAHQALLSSIPADSETCRQAQLVYHECFWCDATSFCIDLPCEEPPPNVTENTTANTTEAFCNYFDNVLPPDEWPATRQLCNQAQQSLYKCDYCTAYLGADTQAKKKAVVWTSRVAAFLSLFGASYILWDTLRIPKNRHNVYHQLLMGMACFDVCTAVAWAFGTAPLPAGDEEEWSHIFGARGTTATCTAQAFFIQLGYTSVFYNVSLTCYYVLVICYSWSELQLRRRRQWLHGIPLLVGIGLALGGIPIYGPFEYACHITIFAVPTYIICIFFAIPIGISIILITAGMLQVYFKVRRQSRATARYSMTSPNLERQVFWQCLSYVMAFYITWPIQFTVYVGLLDEVNRIGFTLLMAFVAPLQGFNNFLVYVRPRVQRYIKKKRKSHRLSIASFLFWRKSSTECTESSAEAQQQQQSFEESSLSSSSEDEFEPSVRIAERNMLHTHVGVEATEVDNNGVAINSDSDSDKTEGHENGNGNHEPASDNDNSHESN
jgi:hypothetical protein